MYALLRTTVLFFLGYAQSQKTSITCYCHYHNRHTLRIYLASKVINVTGLTGPEP